MTTGGGGNSGTEKQIIKKQTQGNSCLISSLIWGVVYYSSFLMGICTLVLNYWNLLYLLWRLKCSCSTASTVSLCMLPPPRLLTARSTRCSLPMRTCWSPSTPFSLHSMVMVKMAWERELCSFMLVAPTEPYKKKTHSGFGFLSGL